MSMSIQAEQAIEIEPAEVERAEEPLAAVTTEQSGVVRHHYGRVRHLAQRGLTTVEYAIGLVAAATAALVLLRIFNDNIFFKTLFDWVINVFTNLVGVS